MALDDTAVRVGITGTVSMAPVGAVMPTTVTAALDAAFKEVGHITEDALTESFKVTKELLKSWQRPTGIRTLMTEVEWTWKLQMLESNYKAMLLYYEGATTSSNGVTATTLVPASPTPLEKAWVVEIVDGDVICRYLIPKGAITDRGDVPHKRDDGTYYEVTVTVLGTSSSTLGTRLTNDPSLVTTPS